GDARPRLQGHPPVVISTAGRDPGARPAPVVISTAGRDLDPAGVRFLPSVEMTEVGRWALDVGLWSPWPCVHCHLYRRARSGSRRRGISPFGRNDRRWTLDVGRWTLGAGRWASGLVALAMYPAA